MNLFFQMREQNPEEMLTFTKGFGEMKALKKITLIIRQDILCDESLTQLLKSFESHSNMEEV